MLDSIQIAPLKQAAAGIAPAGCHLYLSVITDYLGDLELSERDLMDAWSLNRQCEYSAGRRCARRALKAVGLENRASLLPDVDRVPVWPEGFVGSITHSRGVAAAMVARSSQYTMLGLDLEKTDRLQEAAMKRVIHPKEADFVQDDQLKASILFSLKEAFYKAQFPLNRTHGSFQDVALKVNLEAGRAEIVELARHFTANLRQLQFAYSLSENHVLSVCFDGSFEGNI